MSDAYIEQRDRVHMSDQTRFSVLRSCAMSASFFALDQRFSCASRFFALRMVECCSAYTISTGRRIAV